jgi:hypothetical protein
MYYTLDSLNRQARDFVLRWRDIFSERPDQPRSIFVRSAHDPAMRNAVWVSQGYCALYGRDFHDIFLAGNCRSFQHAFHGLRQTRFYHNMACLGLTYQGSHLGILPGGRPAVVQYFARSRRFDDQVVVLGADLNAGLAALAHSAAPALKTLPEDYRLRLGDAVFWCN